MITIALLDDEQQYVDRARDTVRASLLAPSVCETELSTVTFTSSSALLEYSAENNIDILILDIHMPEPSGITVAEHFHSVYPETLIIFLSNYEQYVFYSLRFSPFRFVRKAYMERELSEAVISAVMQLTATPNFLEVSVAGYSQMIPYSKIIYIEKIKGKNYLTVNLSGESVTLRQNITSLEKTLLPFGFTKISSGILVNMRYIHNIGTDSLTLQNGTVLKISGGYGGRLKSVKEDFIKYMRNNPTF